MRPAGPDEADRRESSRPGYTLPLQPDLVTRPLPVLLLLALLAALIYSNTFSIPFLFDDLKNIVENQRIRDLRNFLDFSGSRYVGYLSFALHYHFGGLDVFGYHLVNLLIHITNGLLVYWLIRLLWCTPRMASGEGHPAHSAWIAVATALLFVAHPIQTQAVTYIVQRFTSLATLFYLLAVVCYLKWRLSSHEQGGRGVWYGSAMLSTVFAMKTKEISFTLPLMLLLVEAVFFRSMTRRRWVALFPFLVALSIIPWSRTDAFVGGGAGFAEQTTEMTRLEYLFTQFRVIMTYVRLLAFPVNQNLDYDYPIYHSMSDLPVFFSLLFLLALFGSAVWFLVGSTRLPYSLHIRLIGFGLLWFFLTLSVESSIIPIQDVIFEHRLYLPSIGAIIVFSTTTAMGYASLKGKAQRSLLVLSGALMLIILSAATYQRNTVWKDGLTLWTDVVRKAPQKARAHSNLGLQYEAHGRWNEAIQEYQIALRLRPTYIEAHFNLGAAYAAQRRWDEAIREYQIALRLKPTYSEAHYKLGVAYASQGMLEAAIQQYQTVLRLQPNFVAAYYQTGNAYASQGRREEAIKQYQIAVRLQPDSAHIHNSLGNAYAALERWEEAIQEYQTALRLKPDLAVAHYNLGTTYQRQGRHTKAIKEFERAVQLKPDFLTARKALEDLSN